MSSIHNMWFRMVRRGGDWMRHKMVIDGMDR